MWDRTALTPFVCPTCGGRVWLQLARFSGLYPFCAGGAPDNDDETHELVQFKPLQHAKSED